MSTIATRFVKVRSQIKGSLAIFSISPSLLKDLVLLVVFWILCSSLMTWHHKNTCLTTLINNESKSGREISKRMALDIEHSLLLSHGIPQMLCHSIPVQDSLFQAADAQFEDNISPAARHYPTLNSFLKSQAKDLPAGDIWVCDQNGVCIAASNFDDRDSFVGYNFSSREYFVNGKKNGGSKQFGIGLVSGLPGFYYSAAVIVEGEFLGVVVVKIRTEALSFCLGQNTAFVANSDGVIVLSNDGKYDLLTIPNTSVQNLPDSVRLARYQRKDFPAIQLTSWDEKKNSKMMRFQNESLPVIVENTSIESEGLKVFVVRPLTGLSLLKSDHTTFFFILAVSGILVLIATFEIVLNFIAIRKAQISAEASNLAKRQFLASVSDEIRTPVNGISGMVSLLLETNLNTEQRHFAETAHINCRTLSTIINRILDFSKLESNSLKLEPTEFNLKDLLEDVTHPIMQKAEEHGLKFGYAITSEVPINVCGDSVQLERILTSLMDNAVKFTFQGSIFVQASLLSQSGNQAVVRFSVTDTGIGIPESKIGLLFSKFTQVDSSATRQFGGTGLGLALAKRLTELMGGQIGVKSEEGKGSEFWFTVSLETLGTGKINKKTTGPLMGKRILLVDDNVTDREITHRMLESWSIEVIDAIDGKHALQLLLSAQQQHTPFDLVILDSRMPIMDGKALANTIKNTPVIASTRLLLMTPLGHSGLWISQANQPNFVGSISKPIRKSELQNLLIKILCPSPR